MAICAGVAVAIAFCQSTRGVAADTVFWWDSPSIQSTVALTPEQVSRLDAIYRESLPARRLLREQLTYLHAQLDRVLAEGRLDDTQGRLLAARVFEAEKRRNIARTIMLLRMYRLLSAEQRGRLADFGVQLFAAPAP